MSKWTEYTPKVTGQAPVDWAGLKLTELQWWNKDSEMWDESNTTYPRWYDNTKYRYKPRMECYSPKDNGVAPPGWQKGMYRELSFPKLGWFPVPDEFPWEKTNIYRIERRAMVEVDIDALALQIAGLSEQQKEQLTEKLEHLGKDWATEMAENIIDVLAYSGDQNRVELVAEYLRMNGVVHD